MGDLPRNTILVGDVLERLAELPDESVHMVVTSPPYWKQRDYGDDGQLGLEPTLDLYIENQVRVFREVWRVLRSDGTLWLNVGDGFASSNGQHAGGRGFTDGPKHANAAATRMPGRKLPAGYKPKDLFGLPWELALALRRDGWYLRCDVVWSKPNPAPESASDRPTRSHEFLFLLSKQGRYYYDRDAVSEPVKKASLDRVAQAGFAKQKGGAKDYGKTGVNKSKSVRRTLENFAKSGQNRRNLRSVWSIAPEPSRLAHYATFPKKLVLPCILAGTSERGVCSCCGAPWRRVIAIDDPNGRLGKSYHDHQFDRARGQRGIPHADGAPTRRTVGWEPACEHEAPLTRSVVLDPYMGTGTTAVVALRQGRDFIGIEINPEYVALAEARLEPERRLL